VRAPWPPEVLATGYAGIDIIARIRRPVEPGWTGIIEETAPEPSRGGCAPNVAVGLARLGISTGVAMVVGDDPEGREYVRALQAEGVDTRHVHVVPGGRTPRTYLFVPPEGPTSLFFDPGAAAQWTAAIEVDLHGVRLAVLTVGPPQYNRQFAAQAVAAGLPLAWQLKGDLSAYPPDLVREFVAGSRFIFMNRLEAAYAAAVFGVPAVADLLRRGPEAIFITSGPQGSEILTAGGSQVVPAAPATVVDPTGAGDAYTAGVLAAMLRGWTAGEAAQLGAVVAAFVVEAWGCQTALPAWEAAVARYTAVFGPLPGRV